MFLVPADMESIHGEIQELRALTRQVGNTKIQRDTEVLSGRIWDTQLRIQAAWEAKESQYNEAKKSLALLESVRLLIAQTESRLADTKNMGNLEIDHLDMVPVEQFLHERPDLKLDQGDDRALLVARLRDEQRRRVVLFQERRQREADVQIIRDKVQDLESSVGSRDPKAIENMKQAIRHLNKAQKLF